MPKSFLIRQKEEILTTLFKDFLILRRIIFYEKIQVNKLNNEKHLLNSTPTKIH